MHGNINCTIWKLVLTINRKIKLLHVNLILSEAPALNTLLNIQHTNSIQAIIAFMIIMITDASSHNTDTLKSVNYTSLL